MTKKAARKSAHHIAPNNMFKEIARRVRRVQRLQQTLNQMPDPPLICNQPVEPCNPPAPVAQPVVHSINSRDDALNQQRIRAHALMR